MFTTQSSSFPTLCGYSYVNNVTLQNVSTSIMGITQCLSHRAGVIKRHSTLSPATSPVYQPQHCSLPYGSELAPPSSLVICSIGVTNIISPKFKEKGFCPNFSVSHCPNFLLPPTATLLPTLTARNLSPSTQHPAHLF